MKLSANFFKSFNLISLSFLALVWRIWSTFLLCEAAKVLKAVVTSRSTVAVAFGTPPGLTWGDAVRTADELVAAAAATLGSGVAAALVSFVLGGVVTSGFATLTTGALGFSAAGLSGRETCADMMAGSTGVPLTVGCVVGTRRAGGVYLLEEVRGGKSSCLRTPLYLQK